MVIALKILANPNNWASALGLATPSINGGPSLYQPGGRHRTVSAALALGGAAVVLTGLMTALVAPEILTQGPPPIDVIHYPMPVPPPPQPQPQPSADPHHTPVLTTPRPRVDIPPTSDGSVILDPPSGYFPLPDGTGTSIGGDTGGMIEIIPPAPLVIAARRDPRYVGSFQPPYPAGLERERVTGRCPVSVSIASSGRVTAVRDMGCTDPAFYRTTERQALSRWRFEPETRNGVAVESTLSQTVVFRLPE
ncbi:MAG: energy transducer TonB [Sphingopyxis sp.]